MLGRNALQISFNLIDNVFNDPELAADLGLTSIWNFASAFMGGSQSDLITRKPFEAQWSPRKALSSLIARALPKIPLFFTIPTELVKYRVFTKAFRSYHSLNPVPTCQDILALAIVVSLPIAHIQVVSSSGVAANLRFNNQARNTIFNRFFPIIGVYAFGMISSGMLGVALAENAVLRRSRRMRNARIFSFLLMALGDVMIAFSTFSGILSSDVIAMTWSILLAMLLISALVLWRRAMQLNGDEHGNSVRRRAE